MADHRAQEEFELNAVRGPAGYDSARRIQDALARIADSGSHDGSHHKQWVLDQVVRILTGCPEVTKQGIDCNGDSYEYPALGESAEYREWVRVQKSGDDGPQTYDWEVGIPP